MRATTDAISFAVICSSIFPKETSFLFVFIKPVTVTANLMVRTLVQIGCKCVVILTDDRL